MERTCFEGSKKKSKEAPASSALAAARSDYLKRQEEHAKARAVLVKGKATRDQEQEEHYSQEAADTAFGVFARMAHAEGFRACLCGKLEREEKSARKG